MAKFYIAWGCKGAEDRPEAPFEYLVHPGVGDGGVVYCNALVEAGDRKAAWVQVLSVFPDAVRQRLEAAGDELQQECVAMKRMPGVKIARPTPA